MPALASRAWYSASITDFRDSGVEPVLATLFKNSSHEVLVTQRNAWVAQYDLLHSALEGINGYVLWEFVIPRMGRRVDAILFLGSMLIVIEFKIGHSGFAPDGIAQVWDYALDIKNFHETSHGLAIVPILVCTEAPSSREFPLAPANDLVFPPVLCGKGDLRAVLLQALGFGNGSSSGLEIGDWMRGAYKPTPTILEAARALYSQHSVEEIARSDAGAKNLAETSARIETLAQRAARDRKKIICFVTGVPGAGKTLVGLDVANKQRESENHAVFLSGNGPLVAVLREALTRDEYRRRKAEGEKVRKGKVAEGVKAFIQNVHHFRDEALIDSGAPADHIAIFDEAQRAWNRQQTSNFMRRKKNRPDFYHSEPEFLIQYMDRHRDWALIVCLVGGGQEINTGEAGIDAWLDAIQEQFPDWEMYISSRLTDSEYASERVRAISAQRPGTHLDDSLHLGVSMRSFRAENLSTMVKAILDCDSQGAHAECRRLQEKYPIHITRDLDRAKKWLRSKARGTERYGLVSSSKAMRLKPHAIDIRVTVDPVIWFLNEPADIRSSFYLEDVATEFHVQGLELDWVCVAWDADLRFKDGSWRHHDFRGDKWQHIHVPERKRYLRNAYRVLLTRARQGMVIFVPQGDPEDPTRQPEIYDETYCYLKSIGLRELPA